MKFFLVLLFSAINLSFFSQIKITSFSDFINDINNSSLEVVGNPSDFDMDYYAKVINLSPSTIQLKVRTTEVDVLSGTENTTCWMICPPYVASGTQAVRISPHTATIQPNDTNNTFVAHYRPSNFDGCSLLKYEWIDANDNSIVYGTLFIRFTHNVSTSCNANLSENENFEFNIFPNPANNHINILISGISGEFNFEVINLLGQKSKEGRVNIQNSLQTNLNVSDLVEGVYFIVLKNRNTILKTSKLVVKH